MNTKSNSNAGGGCPATTCSASSVRRCKVCGTVKTVAPGMWKRLWCPSCGGKARAEERLRRELQWEIGDDRLVDLLFKARNEFPGSGKFKQSQIMAAARSTGISWRWLGQLFDVSHEKARYIAKGANSSQNDQDHGTPNI